MSTITHVNSERRSFTQVLPNLPSPYKIRLIEQSDIPHILRFMAYNCAYSNYMDSALNEPTNAHEKHFKCVLKHCLRDKLSFVVVNENEPVENDEQVIANLKDPLNYEYNVCESVLDAEASRKKLSRHYVGCIMAYDCAVAFPFHELPNAWEYHAVFMALFQDDLRKDPSHPHHQYYLDEQKTLKERKDKAGWKEGDPMNMDLYLNDKRVHIFGLAASPLYSGKGFERILLETVRDSAFASGFTSLEGDVHGDESIEKVWRDCGAVEAYRGHPNKVSKVENGVELSHWKHLERSFPYFHIQKSNP